MCCIAVINRIVGVGRARLTNLRHIAEFAGADLQRQISMNSQLVLIATLMQSVPLHPLRCLDASPTAVNALHHQRKPSGCPAHMRICPSSQKASQAMPRIIHASRHVPTAHLRICPLPRLTGGGTSLIFTPRRIGDVPAMDGVPLGESLAPARATGGVSVPR